MRRGCQEKDSPVPLHILEDCPSACIFHSVSPPAWSFRLCRRGNLSPCARWSLSLLASPACIFRFVSPPVWSSRRWQRRIWHRVPAGRCRYSPRRCAFFVLYPRRYDRFGAGGGEFGAVCPPVAAVVRLTGVHFSSYFPASLFVSPLPAVNLSSAGPLPFLISPACKKGAAGKSIALHRGCPKSHEMT